MTPCTGNRNQLFNLLNSTVIEEIDDDLTMIYGTKGFGMPLHTTVEGLIKRENDPISGNIPFTQTVRILIFTIPEL